jgi:hypothetical protein
MGSLRAGIGVVVIAEDEKTLVECLDGIAAQIERPRQVVVLCDSPDNHARAECERQGWTIAARDDAASDPSAVATMFAADPSVGAVAFVRGGTQLSPEGLRACGDVFARDRQVGVVSAWTRSVVSPPTLGMPHDPEAPGAWWPDGVAPFVIVRIDAMRQALAEASIGGSPSTSLVTDLVCLVTAAGWRAVTYPRVLATHSPPRPGGRPAVVRYSAMARTVQRAHLPWRQWWRTVPMAERRQLVAAALRHPIGAIRQCAAPIGRAMRLFLPRRPMAGA